MTNICPAGERAATHAIARRSQEWDATRCHVARAHELEGQRVDSSRAYHYGA